MTMETTYLLSLHPLQLLSQILVFLQFLIFLLLNVVGGDRHIYHSSLLSTLSKTTMSGWFPITCSSVCICSSNWFLSWSSSITFGGEETSEFPVQAWYRCVHHTSYLTVPLHYLLASNTLLLCADCVRHFFAQPAHAFHCSYLLLISATSSICRWTVLCRWMRWLLDERWENARNILLLDNWNEIEKHKVFIWSHSQRPVVPFVWRFVLLTRSSSHVSRPVKIAMASEALSCALQSVFSWHFSMGNSICLRRGAAAKKALNNHL